jgi:hypothetical protein
MRETEGENNQTVDLRECRSQAAEEEEVLPSSKNTSREIPQVFAT